MESIIAKAILYDWDNKLTLKIKATVGLNSGPIATLSTSRLFYSLPLISKSQCKISRDKNKSNHFLEKLFTQG